MTKNEWHENFVRRMRNLMHNRLLTEADLSRLSNVSKVNVYRYLNQGRIPDCITIVNFAHALEVDADTLIDFGEYVVEDPTEGIDIYETFRRGTSEKS